MTIIRDIYIDDYHASDYVSASKLSRYVREGARSYYDHYIAKTAPKRGQSAAMLLGQAFEDLIQRPEAWEDTYVVRPPGLNLATKAGKAWSAEQTLTVISSDDYDTMERMAEGLADNDRACQLTLHGLEQITARAEYPGLPGLQARPDWASVGCAVSQWHPYTVDLKTTSTFDRLVSGRGIADYRYHVQAAIAASCLSADYGAWPFSYLLVCESVAPYRCQVVMLPGDWIRAGWETAQRGLRSLASHYDSGLWPRVDHQITELAAVPQWVKEMV